MVDSVRLRGTLAATVTLLLLACAPSQEKAAEPPEAEPVGTRADEKPAVSAETRSAQEKKPASVATPPPEQLTYVVLPDVSDVRIFVYRTGRLATTLGHNHVISSPDVQGTMVLTPELTGSIVDIRVPVATLVVDDPEQRKEAGPDFQTQLSDEDVASVRHTMLSSRVLDAGPYPLVTIKATVTGGTPPELQAYVVMTLHGTVQQFQSPVKFEKDGMLAVAKGSYTIRQTDFGIEPFSMLGGSLAVKDEVKIQYRIVGRPQE